MPNQTDGVPISVVAARTGVGVATLRAWEQRFDFPQPLRLASGHRRYPESEVDRIRHVVAQRQKGRTLEAAISSLAEAATNTEPSIFAGVRRLRPELPVQRLSRRAMLAISRAIEDETLARGGSQIVVGAFQREAAYRRVQPIWEELARTAALAVAFADFPASQAPGADGIVELTLPPAAPLRREWAVISAGPAFAACLTGWARPPGFEAIWSVEPDVVRLAAQLGLDLAGRLGPERHLRHALPELLDPLPSTVMDCAVALTNRIVENLDRLSKLAPG